ncbi:MAG TPA: CHAT domain-containing protein, partial [Pyrinomonadaceae bacterium]|nr:CHAT domain-containing protein [Pyrinomonadaceae bacterium]
EEEQVELRLLADADYSEEFEIVENQLVDQYIEGTLSVEERIQFDQYFLRAPERKDKLAFATALSKVARERTLVVPAPFKKIRAPWYSFSSIYLKAAAVIVVAVGLGLGVWLLLARRPDEEKGLADLRAAYRNQRLVEARVTKLDYAPLATTRGQGKPNVDETLLRKAELQLLKDLDEHSDAKAQHSLGRFYLAGRQFDKAIEHLELALKQEPNDAQINSDLGAALLELGEQEDQDKEAGKAFSHLTRALEYINKALQINPNLPEALYNKALCLQYMKTPEQAKEAWQNYLAHDPQSKWAEEANRYLQSLSSLNASPLTASQLMESFLAAFHSRDDAEAWQIMSRNRDIITGKMISPQLERRYISSTLSGEKESAQESLRAFLYAGELDKERGGDSYTSELAHYYAASSAKQHRLLSEAVKNVDQGYALCLEDNYGEAAQRFKEALVLFNEAGDVWEARLADYWRSYCYTQLDRINESIALLKSTAEFCRGRDYKWLLAQAYGWLAVNYTILSQHSDAIKYYQQSLALATSISDTYQMQKALTGLGNQYTYLRQPQLSLEHYYRSLSLAAQSNTSPRQAWRNFLYTASALFAFKDYEAAAAFANEALRLGEREFNDPSLSYMLHLNLGQIYSKLQRFDEALYQANLGLQLAQSVQDEKASRKFTAAAFLKQAHIWREAGDYDQAIRFYNQAIGLYEQMEFDLYRYTAYKGRLLCSLALKDEEGIQHDLPLILGLSERYRSQIREEQYRNSFFDTEQSIYDIAIEYEHQKQNDVTAINYAEAAHARSLLDALQSGGRVETTTTGPNLVFSQISQPSDLKNIRESLPAQVQILMYTVLPTKLLIWNISRERLAVYEKEISADTLEADVQSYVNSLKEENAESRQISLELGTKLYGILIGPAEKNLGAEQKLCIIPDKFLYYLPFAALTSPGNGKYLIENWALFYAPSLNVLSRCSEIAQKREFADSGAILSIGNPTFDRQIYPNLPTLDAAEREAREVASLFNKPVSLLGSEADKISTLRAMQSAEIIHFAGHYVVDDSNPLLSRMLLAARAPYNLGEQSSTLSASEILGHRFDRTKLIVLSACQTGFDKY